MNTWSGIIMVALLHITSFKPHNDCYESYCKIRFITDKSDKKAEAQKVKYVCDITNLLSGTASIYSSTNGEEPIS